MTVAAGSRPKILYVDDERANLVAFRAMLRDSYDVLIAESAEEGYERLRSDSVLVVVSDQRMPGQTGSQFLERVSSDYPETVRIILTGYSDIDAVIDAVNRGKIFYYFKKPWAEAEVRMILRNAVHDILNQRRLAESERKYRTVIETTGTGFIVTAPDGVILDANEAYVRLAGRERREEVVGHRAAEWIAPGDLETRNRGFREALERGVVRAIEVGYVDAAGRRTPVEVSASRIESPEGPVVLALVADISERRKAEKALQEAEARYRMLFEESPDGVVILDAGTTLPLLFNRAVHSQLGYTAEEFCRLRIPDYEAAEGPEETRAHAERLLLEGRDDFETRHRTKGGEVRHVMVTVKSMDFSGRPAFHAIYRDITERKRAEEAIRRLNEELEQRVAERTAELHATNREMESFAHSVSHDLRAPLRAIDGFSEMLVSREAGRLDEESSRLLDVIRKNTSRMAELIEAMLALSRVGRAEIRTVPIDMTAMARTVFGEVAGTFGAEAVDFRLADLPQATGDPVLLRQVWANLLANALKYSSRRERPTIEVGSREEAGLTAWYVRDNGAGFDPKYGEKLFRAFQRLHAPSEFPGIGVGLALVNRIVARHGGTVGAEGKVGEGATFWFSLQGSRSC